MTYTEAVAEYFKLFQHKFKIAPQFGDKQGKNLKKILLYVESQAITDDRFKSALKCFFESEGYEKEGGYDLAIFCSKFNAYLLKSDPVKIERPKPVIVNHVIKEITIDDMVESLQKKYPENSETFAKEWVHRQRWLMNLEGMTNPVSRTYQTWVKAGKAAKLFFGEDLINRLWRETSEKPKPGKALNDQIHQAKLIENKLAKNIETDRKGL